MTHSQSLAALPTLLIARPLDSSRDLMSAIQQQGWQAVHFCPLQMVLLPEVMDTMQQVALDADVIFVVSPSAVHLVMPHLTHIPQTVKFACVGEGSAKALARYVAADRIIYPNDGHDSEAVLRLPFWQGIAGKNVLILRAQTGRHLLADSLQAKGARVMCLSVYERRQALLDWTILSRLLALNTHIAVLVGSKEMAQQLFTQVPTPLHTALKSLLYFSIHPRITAFLHEQGISRVVNCATDHDKICAQLQYEWDGYDQR